MIENELLLIFGIWVSCWLVEIIHLKTTIPKIPCHLWLCYVQRFIIAKVINHRGSVTSI